MDKRQINERYAEIGAELIKSEPALSDIANSEATIIYLSSEQKKSAGGKTVFAQCERVPDKYKWGIPCEFTITIFEPNIEEFTEEQIRILLFHELLHVGIEIDNSGEEIYSIKPHDLEDFKLIIDRYGTEWADTPHSLEFEM